MQNTECGEQTGRCKAGYRLKSPGHSGRKANQFYRTANTMFPPNCTAEYGREKGQAACLSCSGASPMPAAAASAIHYTCSVVEGRVASLFRCPSRRFPRRAIGTPLRPAPTTPAPHSPRSSAHVLLPRICSSLTTAQPHRVCVCLPGFSARVSMLLLAYVVRPGRMHWRAGTVPSQT